MLKDLIKVANRLDSLNLKKEADELDRIIKKLAWPWDAEPNKITKNFDFGNEDTSIRYMGTTDRPYEYQTFYKGKGTIYCAPGAKEMGSSSLCTELSLEAWNKKIEYPLLLDKLNGALKVKSSTKQELNLEILEFLKFLKI